MPFHHRLTTSSDTSQRRSHMAHVLTAGLAPASRDSGLPHTNNLVGEALAVGEGIGGAKGEVDDPGNISVEGNRRTRPEIITHITFGHPISPSG